MSENQMPVEVVLINQEAIQNDFPSWTYQVDAAISLTSDKSETLQISIHTCSDPENNYELAQLELSFSLLDDDSYQLHAVLNGLSTVSIGTPGFKIGIITENDEFQTDWSVLEVGAIHALKQIPTGKKPSRLSFQLSGLCLPYVNATNTLIQSATDKFSFTQPLRPELKYRGDFRVDGHPFNSLQAACLAVMKLVLPMSLPRVELACTVEYQYKAANQIPIKVPVEFLPNQEVDDINAFAAELSAGLSNWLKNLGDASPKTGDFLFKVFIFSTLNGEVIPSMVVEHAIFSLNSV